MENEPSTPTNPAIYWGSNLVFCSIKILNVLNGTILENSQCWKILAAKPLLSAALYVNIYL